MYDVITVGSATRDVLIKSDEFRVSTDPRFVTGRSLAMELGTKITVEKVHFTTGGAGTNTAVTFARQGFKTACAIRVGEDVSGDAIAEELKREKVSVSLMERDKKEQTAYSVILEPPAGERTILAYRGANENLEAKDLAKTKSHWVYLSSISAKTKILQNAIDLKKKHGTLLAWNPGGTDLALGVGRLQKYLKYIDVFIVNKEEASKLLNVSYKKEKELFKKFDELIDGVAVMTMGPEGVLASDGETVWRAGTFKEKRTADRTGAGDAFGSGFTAGLLHAGIERGKKITAPAVCEALRIGSANATSKVEQIGAKSGLLAKKQLKDKRWRSLAIKSVQI